MTLFLFTWYIMLHIPDTQACQIWLSNPPTHADVIAACNPYDLNLLILQVVTYQDGELVCTLSGEQIYHAHELCSYSEPVDQYVLRLIEPAHDVVGCAVTVSHEGPPSADEVIDQCGLSNWLNTQNGSASLAFSHSIAQEPPAPVCPAPDLPSGPSLYDQAESAADLWTDDQYTWLAGRLIWYGVVRPNCAEGYSGLDPETLAANSCGMRDARGKVIEWQNQFDSEIYNAALTSKVPARLLKRMIGIESQFWPLYIGQAGETGIMQVTENGADTLMRFDPTFKPWYSGTETDDQFWLRLDVRNSFNCINCDLFQSVEQTKARIPMYARLLAAYRCRAVSITPALAGQDAWRQAAVDYNGSGEYLRRIEQ